MALEVGYMEVHLALLQRISSVQGKTQCLLLAQDLRLVSKHAMRIEDDVNRYAVLRWVFVWYRAAVQDV